MLIIPEIQIQDGRVITRSASEGNDTVHGISPLDALEKFTVARCEYYSNR